MQRCVCVVYISLTHCISAVHAVAARYTNKRAFVHCFIRWPVCCYRCYYEDLIVVHLLLSLCTFFYRFWLQLMRCFCFLVLPLHCCVLITFYFSANPNEYTIRSGSKLKTQEKKKNIERDSKQTRFTCDLVPIRNPLICGVKCAGLDANDVIARRPQKNRTNCLQSNSCVIRSQAKSLLYVRSVIRRFIV